MISRVIGSTSDPGVQYRFRYGLTWLAAAASLA